MRCAPLVTRWCRQTAFAQQSSQTRELSQRVDACAAASKQVQSILHRIYLTSTVFIRALRTCTRASIHGPLRLPSNFSRTSRRCSGSVMQNGGQAVGGVATANGIRYLTKMMHMV